MHRPLSHLFLHPAQPVKLRLFPHFPKPRFLKPHKNPAPVQGGRPTLPALCVSHFSFLSRSAPLSCAAFRRSPPRAARKYDCVYNDAFAWVTTRRALLASAKGIHAALKRDGVKLTTLVARELTPDGILGSRIHVVDDGGDVRIEIARVLDLCKWTWKDYTETLADAGFRKVFSVKEKGVGREPYILNVAVR